jgi:hypothetical protein
MTPLGYSGYDIACLLFVAILFTLLIAVVMIAALLFFGWMP